MVQGENNTVAQEKECITKNITSNEYTMVTSGPASAVLNNTLIRSSIIKVKENYTSGGWQNIMTDDFEGVFPGSTWDVFAVSGHSDSYWGKDNYRAHSPTHSIFCAKDGTSGVNPPADYPNDMLAYMVS